jgi:hypothetical protein
MALSFIILTLLIAGSIIAGSYSMYLPFFLSMQQNSQQIEAYYIARAAMERWQLVAQYHPLWFAWSGWFDVNGERWPSGENAITQNIPISKMWRITNNQNEANRDNKIYVDAAIKIYLWYDNTSNPEQYYQDIPNYTKYEWIEVSIDIQIPPELKEMLGEADSLLCNWQEPGCDIDNDRVYDDITIHRDRKGQEWRWAFTIIPYTELGVWAGRGEWNVDYREDTNIRESIVNIEALPTLLFTDTFNPLAQNNGPDAKTWHNLSWTVLSGIQSQTFSDLLANNEIEYNMIWLHMLYPAMRRDAKLYPYLNYTIHGEHKLAEPMNTIQAYAQIHQNYITIQSTKPNILTQQKGSFTISTSTNE